MSPQHIIDLVGLKSKITQLPTLPTVVTKVLQLVNNPKTSAEDLSKYIENDIALSSMVLKLANSAFYGIPQTVSSIQTAIVIMGQNSLKTLVIPASMVGMFPARSAVSLVNWDAFWVHSVETAVFARAIAMRIPGSMDKEQLFTAGLLHDVGRLILNQLEPQIFESIVQDVAQGKSWREAELEHLGYGSAEVGDALFESWNFPESIREPVRHQHDPERAGRSVQSAWIVNLAQKLSLYRGAFMVQNEPIPELDQDSMKVLGLRGTEAELLESLAPDLEKASAFLNLFNEK